MLTFTIRRLLLSIPTLLLISLVIFGLLQLAPGDPMAQVPLTVPPEVKEKMRQALGLGEAWYVQYYKWLIQFFWIEPKVFIDYLTQGGGLFGWLPDTSLYQGELRVISWQTRSPVMDIVAQRMPQTLWVVGLSYIVGILIAIPIGIYSAYRHYSLFDQAGTFVTMGGFSIPPFFTGQTTAQISRYMRGAMLDNLNQDYVRTARAKGLSEAVVVMGHVLRNSMIPVVTVIALGMPAIFGGAIITENVFKVNGIGQLLLTALFANDLPMLDPRIRYD